MADKKITLKDRVPGPGDTVIERRWKAMNLDERGYADEFQCPVCKAVIQTPYYIDDDPDFRFCPYCGSRIQE